MPPGLTVHGKDPRPAGTEGAGTWPGATAVLARALDAKLGGRKGCNTAASRSDEGAGNALRSPDDRSKKIQIPWLGAGPRAAGHQMRTAGPALTEDRSELPLLAGLQHAGPILPLLGLAILSTVDRLTIPLAGSSSPPQSGCGLVGDFPGDTTITRYYLGVLIGGTSNPTTEAATVKTVSPLQALALLNKRRDRDVLRRVVDIAASEAAWEWTLDRETWRCRLVEGRIRRIQSDGGFATRGISRRAPRDSVCGRRSSVQASIAFRSRRSRQPHRNRCTTASQAFCSASWATT